MSLMIEGLPLWLAQTNCWLVAPNGPGGECVLVDAPPDPSAIIDRLEHHGLRLVAIINTHGHIDHIGGVGTLAHLDDHEDGAHAHLVDGELVVHIHEADGHMLLDPAGTSGAFGRYLEGLDLRPPELVHGLDHRQQVRGAGMTFTCLHTPGHTQGSVCFQLDVDGAPPILFSGDHLFAGSIGRTDLPGGDFEQLMGSMAEHILPLADDTEVLPGHGPTTTIGRERISNPFLQELRQRGD
jgi:hydroxyacylglutathione hydrolase